MTGLLQVLPLSTERTFVTEQPWRNGSTKHAWGSTKHAAMAVPVMWVPVAAVSAHAQRTAAAQSHSTQPPHTATAHSHSTQPQRTATARTRRTQPQYTATARRHLHLHVRPVPVMRKAIATVDSEDHEQRTVAGDNHVVLVGALMTQTSDCIGLHMIAGSNAHPISMGTK